MDDGRLPEVTANTIRRRIKETYKPLPPSDNFTQFEHGHIDGWNKAVASLERWLDETEALEEAHIKGLHESVRTFAREHADVFKPETGVEVRRLWTEQGLILIVGPLDVAKKEKVSP